MFLQPKSVEAALAMMAEPGARLLAGGTDFFPAQGEQVIEHPVIDISRLADLRGIATTPTHIRIGGAATWSEIVAQPLPRGFDALKAAAKEIGSIQIQNRGTIAGNLCNASPAADSVPPLMALEAEVELLSAAGTRRLPLGAFILGNRKTALLPGEMVSAILVPRNVAENASAFGKLGARRYLVISIVMIAVAMSLENGRVGQARIAIGACSAVAQRLAEAEAALVGCRKAEEIAGRLHAGHLAALAPIDDVRATAGYRRDAALILLRRVAAAAMLAAGN
ncbi:CO/xanthine dehydrogenase FAD-binding subunit [Dongia mobilis]|uniref:CO/xanthine dehydrogenase FAD-binding subunit n=1 Tax=Dongia mobilis TaxID=578943 RepID=A0A4R6WK40_9PROT|nr:xanthine dehydrogenase family protein subunit M [Dongia mobilis]TDQ80656.1 CO/xanthine dehydrogenase FAD-binding subunit [Dongia mobilis]